MGIIPQEAVGDFDSVSKSEYEQIIEAVNSRWTVSMLKKMKPILNLRLNVRSPIIRNNYFDGCHGRST